MLVQNAVWLGIEGPDLDSALSFAGQQGWIENDVNDTTVLTPAGYASTADGTSHIHAGSDRASF